MATLPILLACAAGLLALGCVARAAPVWVARLRVALCLVGVIASIAALLGGPVASLSLGLAFGVDGLSAAVLAALFVMGAAGAAGPAALGALAAAVLAADGFGLALGLAGAVMLARRGRPPLVAAAVLGGLVAALLLAGMDPRFVAVRAVPPEGIRAALMLLVAAGAAGAMPFVLPGGLGGVAGIYVLARLLLDLPGPVTPVWWGVPVLAAGGWWAVQGALEAARAPSLDGAWREASLAAQGAAVLALGAALLARGADLLPLSATAVAAALLQLMAWSLWGALLTTCTAAVHAAAGGTELSRLGGLLRRAPATGLALLAGLAAMAALPVTAGFAGLWAVTQALTGAGRLGGVAVALVAAAALAALGLAWTLLAAAAIRLAGVVLLGAPRTARAAAVTEPPRAIRLGLATLAGGTVLLGVVPWLAAALATPGARLLAGALPATAGPIGLGALADGPVYAALPLAAAVIAAAALAARAAGPNGGPAPPWQGGFIEDGIGRGNTWPIALTPPTRRPRPGAIALATLALILAAALGWAAR